MNAEDDAKGHLIMLMEIVSVIGLRAPLAGTGQSKPARRKMCGQARCHSGSRP